jgi:hypothetical protein
MPGSPHLSLSLRFSHQNPVDASPLPHTCYMPCPSHSSSFHYTHNSGWGVQIMELQIMTFYALSSCFAKLFYLQLALDTVSAIQMWNCFNKWAIGCIVTELQHGLNMFAAVIQQCIVGRE